ncbi:MAG: single-stranded-DNA-specific exonuclease RecJ, partial [Marinomonas sp.]
MRIVQRSIDHNLENLFPKTYPKTLACIYQARGVLGPEELEYKLASLAHPKQFFDINNAATILADAIEHEKRIVIVGDFDADGATSTTLGILALTAMGAVEPQYIVPNRFEYGYGLTPEIVTLVQEQEADVLVTVDNGIASIDGVAAAKAAGMQVIVTDHHLPGDVLP